MKRRVILCHHRNRKKNANRHLSEHYKYVGEQDVETSILLTTYNEHGVHSQALTKKQYYALDLKRDANMHWVEINGLTDSELVSHIVKSHGLHRLDAKDILTPQHIAKVEDYEDKLLLVINVCYYDDAQELQVEHICLLITKQVVFSFRERNQYPIFEEVKKALADNVLDIRSGNSGQLMIHLLNAITSCFVETATQTEDMLEDIEDLLFDIDNAPDDTGQIIQQRRKDAIMVRRNMTPLKDQFNKLPHCRGGFVSPELLPLFTDMYDQVLFTLQTTESCREITSSLVDLYISNNDLRLNSIMKRLTVVSTIFIPLTFLAGIWGMNFKFMPELDWRYGYLIAWLVMFVAAFLSWLYLRRRGWNK